MTGRHELPFQALGPFRMSFTTVKINFRNIGKCLVPPLPSFLV